jgi:hypothetical protein
MFCQAAEIPSDGGSTTEDVERETDHFYMYIYKVDPRKHSCLQKSLTDPLILSTDAYPYASNL